jgi:hypothetical protein
MCPVCIATAAAIAGSATGTGGLTAFVARKFLRAYPQPQDSTAEKENHDGNSHNQRQPSQDRLAG